MSPSHTLSIMAVAFNEAQHVSRLRAAAGRLRLPPGMTVETILVDGGSSDGTAEAARAAGFDKVIVLPGANIPVCRNRAVREASGDWLAFLDADCEPAEDWVEQARPFLESAPKIMIAWPARPPEPHTWVQAAWLFHWMNKNRRLDDWGGRPVVKTEGFRLATTRNMIFPRVVYDEIGGFNEELATGEDTDFAFRVYMTGIPVLGVPALRAFHHGEPRTLGQFYRQQLWHANRRSYEHIRRISRGRVGGNAPLFSALFLACVILGSAGLATAAVLASVWPLAALLPLAGLTAGPALLISARGGTIRHFPALCLIYLAYGWARMLDLLGLARTKTSWKKAA